MAFTFYSPPQLTREQANPWQAALTNALERYGQLTKADYMRPQMQADLLKKQMHLQQYPQLLEAEVFSKKFSPLAALATTPRYMQDPRFRHTIDQLISQHLGASMTGGQEPVENNNIPTYEDYVKSNEQKAENISKELTKAGKAKTAVSSASAQAQDYLGDLGKNIMQFLGLKYPSTELATKENELIDEIKKMKNRAVQSGYLNEHDAEERFAKKKNETNEQWFNRTKKIGNESFSQDKEHAYYQDQTDKIAAKLEAAGFNVPIPIIYQYLTENKGKKVSIPNLLKKAGIKYE